MSQYNNQRSQAPGGGGGTRPNNRPNPVLQPRKPTPTYRARPQTSPLPVRPGTDVMASLASARHRTDSRRRRVRFLFIAAAFVVLVVGAVAYMLGQTAIRIADTIINISVTPVPVIVNPDGSGTPIPKVFPNWDRKEPVNILLIGLDYRPENEDTRADTQIIVHIDPANKTAAMLSIPRDLWVSIPGYGEDRINSAYQHGENDESIPGGGPGLAMATIEEDFGIPINYFAEVKFRGFEKLVDALGGINIDVPKPLVDNDYPLSYSGGGSTRIYIPAGLQHMDGKTTLEYARSRHADSDIGRNSRQQQVLLALRQQGLNLNIISHLEDVALKASDAITTDLSFIQVGQLATLSKDIGADSIQTVVLAPPCVSETILASGADVLIPNWDCIRPKVAQAFSDPKLAKEGARIAVLNGTNTNGIGRKVDNMLTTKGFVITMLDAAPDQGLHPTTTITDYTGNQMPHTLEALAKALDINISDIIRGDAADAPIFRTDGLPVDIVVTAGDDQIK